MHGGEAETTTEEHEEGDSHSEEEHELEVREEAENELEGKYFCDAAQYSITLLEKAKKIQEFITANSTTKFQFKEDTTDTKTQKDFEDTDNLWRFVKPQVQIEDKGVAAKPKLVFFLDELTIGDTIIDSRIYSDATKLESNANVKQLITYFNNPPIADKVDTIISTMESILTNISTDASVRNGSDIVAEIDVTDWDSINIKILQDLTGETTLAFGNKYLMTFNEFKALHKAIAAENNCKSPVCSITLYGNVTILLDTDFMQALYKSIEFKIGIRNIDGLSDEEEDDVKDNVPDYEEITWPNDAEDYHEFGENFLEFESLFILDGYSQDFKNDFKTEFGERIYNEVGFGDNWAFDVTGTDKVAKVVQPGKHPVKLNYNWSTESTPKISVTIDVENGRTLNMLDLELATKYKDNYFFYFPIDGKVGSNNNKREGYGISFNSTDKASNIYFNQITVAFNDSANKAIQNFGSSEVDSADGKFAKTRLGIVLDAETNNKFHYYPSIPVAILTKITGSNGTDGLFYSLHSGNDVGEKEKLSYVLEWKQSCTQSPIKDKKQSINAFCSGNSSEYYGLTPDIQERTTKGYGTIAYLPHTQQIYTLDLICSKEKTKTTILPFKEGFSAKTLDQSRTTGSLDIKSFTVLKDIAENAGERHIDQFINSIKKDEMCFKPGDNGRSIVIKWNENKIFEPLKNECSAVTTSD
ncbi:MAG: hypothetical protein Q7S21_03830 [archaeon]|nr:hypothetical protein [archaeon]